MLIFPAAMCFFFTERCFLTTAILLNEHQKNPSIETVLGFLYAVLFVYIYQIPAQIILLPKDLTLYASVVSSVSPYIKCMLSYRKKMCTEGCICEFWNISLTNKLIGMIKAGICTGRFYKNKAMFACCNAQGCKFARHSLNAPPEISRFSEPASVLIPGYGSFVIFVL